jgi:hypothetical protein
MPAPPFGLAINPSRAFLLGDAFLLAKLRFGRWKIELAERVAFAIGVVVDGEIHALAQNPILVRAAGTPRDSNRGPVVRRSVRDVGAEVVDADQLHEISIGGSLPHLVRPIHALRELKLIACLAAGLDAEASKRQPVVESVE